MEEHGVGYSSTGLIARMRVEAEERRQAAKLERMASGQDEREALEAVRGAAAKEGAKAAGQGAGKEAVSPSPSSPPSLESPRITVGSTEVVLAAAYGFCWGVERAVQMAYEARHRFPDATVHITNEIIHNPIVNEKLKGMNVHFIQPVDEKEQAKSAESGARSDAASPGSSSPSASIDDAGVSKDFSGVRAGDVVILPAFGASVQEMRSLHARGARLVDTTCPWVSKVWNAVDNQARRGHTSVIHGKWAHEETLATASFAGAYVVVKDLKQAKRLAEVYMVGKDAYDASEKEVLAAKEAIRKQAHRDDVAQTADDDVPASPSSPCPSPLPESLLESFFREFSNAHSAGFDPRVDLERIGMANQTTMLKGETYAIGKLLEARQMQRFGPENLNLHYMVMDTICDATQERQDAVTELVKHQAEDPELGNRLDALVVVGGFNSSNTSHLQEIGEFAGVPSFWVDSAARIDVEKNTIEHKTAHGELVVTSDWLPSASEKKLFRVGVTSGASTPDRAVEDVLDKVFAIRDPGFNGVPKLDVPVGKPTHADAR